MQQYTIIFIGKSGAGKGTQVDQLHTCIKEKDSSMYHVQAGQKLREFITTDTFTSRQATINNSAGKLQPTFLAIWAWSAGLISDFAGQDVMCIDGVPRRLNEAYILDEALDFYDRKHRFIIHLDVSDEWSKDRLAERNRPDDVQTTSVEERLQWFRENNQEILNFFTTKQDYTIVTINGEQSIEAVHKDICHALNI